MDLNSKQLSRIYGLKGSISDKVAMAAMLSRMNTEQRLRHHEPARRIEEVINIFGQDATGAQAQRFAEMLRREWEFLDPPTIRYIIARKGNGVLMSTFEKVHGEMQ